MKTTGLSFDNIPPLHVPLRFFLTAPLFGLAAGALLLVSGDIWISRWHPALLGFTHLLTLGVMAMVMLGALYQVMPVVSALPLPGTRKLAPAVHLLLSAGTLMLVGAFLSLMPDPLLLTALILLLLAFIGFLLPLALALFRATPAGDSVFAIRLAAIALLIALSFGVLRAASYIDGISGFAGLTSFHIGWGLAGWVVLLVMGVSFQAIPMFHVAPNFSPSISRGGSLALFFCLLLVSLLQPGSVWAGAAILLGVGLILTWATSALRLIQRRRRRLKDSTIHFWQLGLGCLIASALLVALQTLTGSDLVPVGPVQILTGLLFGYGFAISVIQGMLQKILPFLMYLHLQRKCLSNPQAFAQLPNMKTLIPSATSRWQFRLHTAALLTLLLSLLVNELRIPASVLIIVDFGWLLKAMLSATGTYRRSLKQIAS